MLRKSLIVWVAGLLPMVMAGGDLPTSAALLKTFEKPGRHYSTGPLWVWNDRLTEKQVRETLQDLAAQEVRQVWVHPRPGLMTPYLSEEWFKLWKAALKEAERLDMNVWIYDENSYPSGFAGGLVPEAMPESRGRGLVVTRAGSVTNAPDVLAVFDSADNFRNVTPVLKEKGALSNGAFLVAREARAENRAWHGNRSYVNLLSPGVTEKFIEITMGAYKKELGSQFGKRIPGVFTDEPNIRPVRQSLPWSEVLAEEFQNRWGYDLMDHLPSLQGPVGDWRKVRYHYYQLLHEQFVKHWAKPNFEYCATNNLEWTGHYWDHEWPKCGGVPDNMAMYAWHQRPAIDCLMNQYREDTHAQFGNVRMVRELSSVANQLGAQRTLCEIYGAGGWDLRFEDMKRIGDWLQVLGVNTLNEHLSYVTIRGARKRDHPQSFSYHEPWWEGYHQIARYFTRLSAALSQGEQINKILVLEPTTTAWMYQDDTSRLEELGSSFFDLLMALEAAQIEYDLVSEDILAHHGSPGEEKVLIAGREEKARTLRVGRREYRTLVIPPFTETLNSTTTALLDKTALSVSIFGAMPPRVDGQLPQGAQDIEPRRKQIRDLLPQLIQHKIDTFRCEQREDGFVIDRSPSDKGKLFHMRRQLKDGELLFLVNTSAENASAGVILSRKKGAEVWDPLTGTTRPYASVSYAGGISASFELPPSGSLLLCLGEKRAEAEFPAQSAKVIPPCGETTVERLEPNVLTIDYVDVSVGGETRSNLYFYPAGQFIWKQHGLEGNPWDSAVQFKDELILKKFHPASGFEATYRFVIKDRLPQRLEFVLERPDLYAISCNGKSVKSKRGVWWLDKSFGKLDISRHARLGANAVTIKASPLTMFHELEPAYLLGDFSLEPSSKGFVVAPDQRLTIDSKGWNHQGHPFYATGVAYRQTFEIAKPSGKYVVSLPKWLGSVARVKVNGKQAGWIVAPPFECDVTSAVRRGDNDIEVTVIGTLKNTLGPHHGDPKLGAAWPSGFKKGPETVPPGRAYSTVGYGLFAPMVLNNLTSQAALTAAAP